MATADTVYRIVNQYEVRDLTHAPLKSIGRELDRTSQKTLGLKKILLGVGAALGGRALLSGAKHALVDYNSSIEQAKIQTAGLLQLNVGGTFSHQMKQADWLIGRLQQRAKKSVGTTKDMVDMMSRIVRPVTAAGLKMKDLEDMTASAVVSARSFGIEAGVAAMDIESALMGNLQKRDRFARALLEPAGFTTESFNALSAEKRAQALMKAFRSPAIMNMAKAQENTWAGLSSTLEDSLQIALGKVGLPLLKEMTAEAKKLVTWIDSNGAKIDAFAKSAANALVTGFHFVRDTFEFIADHKTLLLTLAKAWLVNKGAGFLGGSLKDLGGMLVGLRHGNQGLDMFGLKLGRMAGKLGQVAGILGTVYTAAQGFADWLDHHHDQKIADEGKADSIKRILDPEGVFAKRMTAQQRLSDLRGYGIVGANGRINEDRLKELDLWHGIWGDTTQMSRLKGLIAQARVERAKDAMKGGLHRAGSWLDTNDQQHQRRLARGNLFAMEARLKNAMEPLRMALERRNQQEAKHFAKFISDMAKMNPAAQMLKFVAESAGRGLLHTGQMFERVFRQPVNVKIEIPAGDPDRFAREFNRAMEQVVARPAAASAIIGGAF